MGTMYTLSNLHNYGGSAASFSPEKEPLYTSVQNIYSSSSAGIGPYLLTNTCLMNEEVSNQSLVFFYEEFFRQVVLKVWPLDQQHLPHLVTC